MPEVNEELMRQLEGIGQRMQQMEGQLRGIQSDVARLPFLARGFVERDISTSTGRSLSEWTAAGQRLHQAIQNALREGPKGYPALAQLVQTELPKLSALRGYLEKAPDKVKSVPAAVLKPQQRTHFLDQVRDQVAALRTLESELSTALASLKSAK